MSVFTMLVYVPRSHDTRPGYKAQTRPTKVLVRVTCSGRTRQKHPARCSMSHESHEDRKADGNGAGVKSRRSGREAAHGDAEKARGLGHAAVRVEEPAGAARAAGAGGGVYPGTRERQPGGVFGW